MSALPSRADHREQPETRLLDEAEGGRLLADYGVAIPPSAVVDDAAAARAAARSIGYPIVLKGVSARVAHKSDAGLVCVGIRDDEQLQAAYDALASSIAAHPEASSFRGVLVQRNVTAGLELIVGVQRDPLFGHMLLLGIGGTAAEVFQDSATALMPVSAEEVPSLLERLRGKRLLQGFRGTRPLDVVDLQRLVAALNHLVADRPDLVELDLNPVIVSNDGLWACDVLMSVAECDPIEPRLRPRLASSEEILHLWSPRSIAVVGASSQPTKNGHRLLKYLVDNGFQGQILPVNRTADRILGLRVYADVSELPEDVDLACIITPGEQVLQILEACVAKGIHAAIVYASGFAESGPEGVQRQECLKELCERTGLRVLGPNSMGLMNMVDGVYAAFGSVLLSETKRTGAIGLVSQSGAMGSALLSRAWEEGAGFSRWVSVANEVDLSVADFVGAMAEDDATRVIIAFLEEVREASTFLEAAEKARTQGKPLIVFKTGTSQVGQRAVRSHTGALAGNDVAYEAAFMRAGIVRARHLEDLVDAARAFTVQPLPRGKRIGVVTASGGACSLIADLCSSYGLDVPSVSCLAERLAPWIPAFGATDNPVDVTAEILARPETFKNVLEVLMTEEAFDGLVIMLTTNADPGAETIAHAIYDVFCRHDKPVVVGRLGADGIAPRGMAFYREMGFPVYPSAERAVRTMKHLVDYGLSS